MLNLAINTYIHIIFIITIVVCLVLERVAVKPEISWKDLNRLLKIDGLYGLAAIIVVATGLLNWLYFGKGEAYYSSNHLFITKFALFIIVGLLSLYPTIWFFKYKKRHKSNPPETIELTNACQIKIIIGIEIALMAIIPLLATLMANGFGI